MTKPQPDMPQAFPKTIGDPWARFARRYDLLTAGILEPLRQTVVDLARSEARTRGLKRPLRVVELCCGTGRQAAMLAEAGFEVAGVDLSPSMLAVGKLSGYPVKFVEADASATGLEGCHYELAVVQFALHEMPAQTRDAVMTEIKRLLTEDGRLVAVDYLPPKSFSERLMHRLIAIPERLAGREHFAGYKDFLARRGLYGLLVKHQFMTRRRESFFAGTVGLALCQPADSPSCAR